MKIKLSNMAHQSLIFDVMKFYIGRMEDWVNIISIQCCNKQMPDEVARLHEVYLVAELKNGDRVEFNEAQPDKKVAIHRVIERLNRYLMRQKLAYIDKSYNTSRINNNV